MTPDDKRRLTLMPHFVGPGPETDTAAGTIRFLLRLLDEAIAREDAAMAALREPPAEMANYIRETSYQDGFFSLRPSLSAAANWIEHNTLAAHSAATKPPDPVDKAGSDG